MQQAFTLIIKLKLMLRQLEQKYFRHVFIPLTVNPERGALVPLLLKWKMVSQTPNEKGVLGTSTLLLCY